MPPWRHALWALNKFHSGPAKLGAGPIFSRIRRRSAGVAPALAPSSGSSHERGARDDTARGASIRTLRLDARGFRSERVADANRRTLGAATSHRSDR